MSLKDFFFILDIYLFTYLFIYLREGEVGRKRKRNINWLHLTCSSTRDLVCSPGMCPDREPNWWCFALWYNAQPAEPCQSGLKWISYRKHIAGSCDKICLLIGMFRLFLLNVIIDIVGFTSIILLVNFYLYIWFAFPSLFLFLLLDWGG